MKLTEWFPGEVKPVRKGVYACKNVRQDREGYCYWNGNFWYWWKPTIQEALNSEKIESYMQGRIWRGIAK